MKTETQFNFYLILQNNPTKYNNIRMDFSFFVISINLQEKKFLTFLVLFSFRDL